MILTLFALAILGTVQAGVNEWTAIGPNGGDIAAVAIAPQNSNMVFALAQFGVFKSTDGGVSWRKTGFTGHANSLAVDPRNSNTIFVATPSGISKSVDGGATWSDASSGLPHGPFMQLVIDPTNSLNLYARAFGLGPALLGPAGPTVAPTVFKSTDGGASWKAATSGLPPTAYALSLAIDPQTPSTLYLGTSSAPFVSFDMHGGLYKSLDGAGTWSSADVGVTNCCVGAIAIDPHSRGTVYAAWAGVGGLGRGLYRSTDSGANWTEIGTDLPGMSGFLTLDPLNPSALYVLTAAGLFESTNSGANWTPVYSAGDIRTFAIDPQRPGTIYAAVGAPGMSDGGVFKTADGGTTWNEADFGIQDIPIDGLAVDPQNQGTIYAANGGKLFKTTDAGAHWIRGAVNARKVLLDPLDSSVVYALTYTGGGGNPTRSADGGLTWSALNPGLAAGDFVFDLVIDPAESGTLFLLTATEGLLKSVDQGATWSSASSGLPADAVSALGISASDPLTLYAGTAVDCDCSLGKGVFRSIDGGASWTEVTNGLSGGAASLVAVDPQDSSTVYVGLSLGDTNALFKSVDGGATWNRLNSGLDGSYAGSLDIDPHNPRVLYVSTYKGVFRSTDGGEHWSDANLELPGGLVRAVVIDPQDSSTVYAATEAGLFVIAFTP